MLRFPLPQVHHDYQSFAALARLYARTKDCFLERIEIDMSSATWFEADMCAALGAILYSLGQNLNTVELTNIAPRVWDILARNGFLSHYGRAKVPDRWGSTISYQRFDDRDDHFFARYIESQFIHRSEMPEMSSGLLKKFRESIFEIFSNAVWHSRTQLGIFSCGQLFPSKGLLNFTVADLGVGMRQNIQDFAGLDLAAEDAIVWATEENNTTRRGPIPGGLGLKLLREFIDLNGGCLQIVSDAGFWQTKDERVSTARLGHPFPGTVVYIGINTADLNSYSLTSELDPNEIF